MFALHTPFVFRVALAGLPTAFFAIVMNIRKLIAFNLAKKLPQSSYVPEHFRRSWNIENENFILTKIHVAEAQWNRYTIYINCSESQCNMLTMRIQ